jgi:hypothetical protein
LSSSTDDLVEGLPKDAGIYTVAATYSDNPNYNTNFITSTITINKVALTATANNGSRPYGAVNPTLTITYTGFVGSENEDVIGTLPTAATTATITSNVGDYPITVSGGSAANYDFTYLPGTLTVEAATPNIAFEDQSGSYSGKAFEITAPLITGAGNIDLSSNGMLSYSYKTHVSTTGAYVAGMSTFGVSWIDGLPKNAGVYDVRAAFTGNANCFGVNDVNVVTINKKSLTVTANNLTRKCGAENPVLTMAYNGFVNGEDASVLGTLPTAATTAMITSNAGDYPITVSGGSAANYSFAYVPGTLKVTAADSPLTPTPAPTATKSPSATATPAATPAPAPTATPAPSATPLPTPSSTPALSPQPSAMMGMTIIPSIIESDEESGTVTIEIDVADLPEGTTSIQLKNGDVIYLDGSDTIRLEIKKEDLDENGRLNIVTLDNEKVPTGSFEVQIENANGQANVPDTGIFSTLLWIVICIAGMGVVIFIVFVVFKKKRRRDR